MTEKQTPCELCVWQGKWDHVLSCANCRTDGYKHFRHNEPPLVPTDNQQPTQDPPSETGTKHDAGKPRTDLLQAVALVEVAKVAEFGAHEYGEENWRLVKGWRRRYLAAALRHLFAHMVARGQDDGLPLDEKTKLPHLAHAAWNCLSLLELSILEGDNK